MVMADKNLFKVEFLVSIQHEFPNAVLVCLGIKLYLDKLKLFQPTFIIVSLHISMHNL